MQSTENNKIAELNIDLEDICKKIIFDKRYRYIYQYTLETCRSRFIKNAAWKQKMSEPDAEEIFADSLTDIIISIEKGRIIIRCLEGSKNTYLSYFWKVLNNKTIDFKKRQKRDKERNDELIITQSERIKYDPVSILKSDDIDEVKTIKYIYDNMLSDKESKYFDLYFIEEYDHDDIVKLNIGINNNDASKSTKSRLRSCILTMMNDCLEKPELMKYIRWRY
jgi:hypothetical protein